MKWTHSIRFRLTVWYSLVLAAGLALFAVSIWLSMRHSLLHDLNRSLQDQASNVGTFVNNELRDSSVNLSEELAEYSHALPDGTYLEVLDHRGERIFSSYPSFPWPSPRAAAPGPYRLKWRRDTFQVLSEPFTAGGQQWQVILAASLRPIDRLISRLRLLLIALIPAVAILATFGGTWLSRRALKPVDEITAAARSIGIANLSERLRVPHSNDELQRLSETWNDMLSRLEDAVTRLSQFTSDASHELRTPLAVIRTTAELAVRRSRPAESYRSALTQILSESERMTYLVDDLLFLARCDADSQEMPMMTLDFAALVRTLCSQIATLAAEKQVSVVTCIPAGEMPVSGNDFALRRLVLALLDNATKYSKQGSKVTVRLSQSWGQALLEIEDEGCGIPDAEIPLIFNRFYRTPEAREASANGYGLGLSLAAAIAQRHGTRIEVESALQSGSTFRICFPLNAEAANRSGALFPIQQGKAL